MQRPTYGRYEVLEELGRGGMGIVYRGEDPMLDRPVAIKTLLPGRLSDQAIDRFQREARSAARLKSPHIVTIYDIGRQEEIYKGKPATIWYIVMEFIQGKTLTDLMQVDPVGKRLEYYAQLLQAMKQAHAAGVVHRDLKPDNVMVDDSGLVKIMDFGLAFADGSHSLTSDGQMMGTPAYLSPEQAQGILPDHRTDIYSLGVILFEILTGRLPFDASHYVEMLRKVVEAPPHTPRTFVPDVAPALERMVMRCLQKAPEARYQSVDEMLAELELYLSAAQAQQRKESLPMGWGAPPAPEAPPSPAPQPPTSADLAPSEPPRPEPPKAAPEPPKPPEAAPPSLPPQIMPHFDLKSFESLEPQPPLEPPSPPAPHVDAPSAQTLADQAPATSNNYLLPYNRLQGSPLLASDRWLQDAAKNRPAEEPKPPRPPVDVRPPLVEPQRDEVAICSRCGAENDLSKKYCDECGDLLAPSHFVVNREADALLAAGIEAYQSGRYQQAIFDLQSAIDRRPSMGEAHLYLGKAFLELLENDKAERALALASQLLADSPEPFLAMADLYQRTDRAPELVDALQEVLRRTPFDSETRCRLAFLLQEAGKVEEAVYQYKKVLKADPHHLHANRQYGLLLAASPRPEEAIRYLEEASAQDPHDAHTLSLLARLYMRARRVDRAQQALKSAIQYNPDNPALHAELGALYQAQNREDLAIHSLQQALRLEQGNREARVRLASILERNGKTDLAAEQLEQALQYHPQDLQIHRRLGELYLADQNLDRALGHFEQVVKLDPASAEMHSRLGRLYLKKNYTDRSIVEYRKAVELHPVDPDYREDLGMAYYCSGQYDMAISELSKAATLDGRNPDYFKALGMLKYELNDYEESIRFLKRSLELKPGDPQGHGMLGQALSRQGLYNMAISEYQRALDLDPSLHLMHLYLARAYAQAGRHGDAINSFRKLASRLGVLEETRLMGEAYVEMGHSYLASNQPARAAEVFQAALQRNPHDARSLHGMARVSLSRHQLQKAREQVMGALSIEPRNADFLATLAEVCGEEGKWVDAVDVLKKAIAYNPLRAELYEKLGRSQRKASLWEDAVDTFRRASEMFPKKEAYFLWMEARVQARQGNWGQAAHLFGRAAEKNPSDWKIFQDLAMACHRLGELPRAIENVRHAMRLAPAKDQPALQKYLDVLESGISSRL